MSEYSMVQTGPKILSGGVQSGSSIFRYHDEVAIVTKGDPAAPPMTLVRIHPVKVPRRDLAPHLATVANPEASCDGGA